MSHQRHFDVMCLLGGTKTRVCKKLSDLENEIYRVQEGVFLTKFGHKLLLSLSAQPDYI